MGFFNELLDDAAQRESERRMFSVTTGKVVENWDDEHPGMVRVELFLGEEGKNKTDWVRVAQPYAGNGYGSYFLPEVGDEVVLAFNLGDRDHPIVIGSLWNQVDVIPEDTAVEENTVKRIKTKGGHELVFDEADGEETLTLHTPGELTLLLEDSAKKLTLKDADGNNLLAIDGDGGIITATAAKKVVLDVGGSEFTLDGQGKAATLKIDNITIEAGQSLKLKGQSVKIEGSMAEFKSDGNLDVKAGGILTLKGSMTKIN